MAIALWLALACGPSTPEGHMAAAVEAMSAGVADVSAASMHFHAACEAGHVPGCSALAALEGAEPDQRRWAAELACDAGDGDACLKRSTEPNDRWNQAACEAGRGAACLSAAAVASDPRERATLLARACHGAELTACLAAGDAWRDLGDFSRSAALYGVRCEAGWRRACWLREATKIQGERAAACGTGDLDVCETACLDGELRHCEAIAERLQSACDGGLGVACTRIGQVRMHGSTSPDAGRVGDLLWSGCDLVDPWACLLLADWVDEGHPLPTKARGDSAWLRDQACDLQLDYACAEHPAN